MLFLQCAENYPLIGKPQGRPRDDSGRPGSLASSSASLGRESWGTMFSFIFRLMLLLLPGINRKRAIPRGWQYEKWAHPHARKKKWKTQIKEDDDDDDVPFWRAQFIAFYYVNVNKLFQLWSVDAPGLQNLAVSLEASHVVTLKGVAPKLARLALTFIGAAGQMPRSWAWVSTPTSP